MLAIKRPILELNSEHLVFSDHHFGVGYSISLSSAGNRVEVPRNSSFLGHTSAFVVGNDPHHFLLVEMGDLSIGEERLRVSVPELPDDNATFTLDDAVFLLNRFIEELVFCQLNNITVLRKPHYQSVL